MQKFRILVSAFLFLSLIFISVPAFSDCPEDDVDCWIGVLEKGDLKAGLKAVMVLGKLGDPKAVDPLIKKLSHKDKYMATAAAYALGKIGKPAALALIKATKDKNPRVRKYAAHALGQIGGDQYTILAELTRDQDPAVRLRAFRALRTLKDERSATDAVIALKDRHKAVKIEAIKLLADLKDTRAVESIINYGLTDLSTDVSLEAAALLIQIGPDVVEPLIRKFEKQPAFVKVRYVFVLGEIARKGDGEKAVKANEFVKKVVLWPKMYIKVKIAAVSKLGDINDPSAVPVLQKLLKEIEGKEKFEELVEITIRVLGKLQNK